MDLTYSPEDLQFRKKTRQWLGMPHAQVARAIELVGAKLVPALRRL